MLKKISACAHFEYRLENDDSHRWISALDAPIFTDDEFLIRVRYNQMLERPRTRVVSTQEEEDDFKKSFEKDMEKFVEKLEMIPKVSGFLRRSKSDHKGCVRATPRFSAADVVKTMTLSQAAKALTAEQFKIYLEESGFDAEDTRTISTVLSAVV